MNPFAVLGIAPRFDLDLTSVEKTHRELSRALHPDRYAGAGASERQAALSKAVEVNEAWRVVKDPIRRAEAVFALAGIPVGERTEPPASPALLMDVMELREELDLARNKKDRARVESLVTRVKAKRVAAEETLRAGFGAANGDAAKMGGLVSALGELRYFRRFLDEASAVEDLLDEAAVG
jgi:molecular chaperone HscB